jgi:hypothetical protein
MRPVVLAAIAACSAPRPPAAAVEVDEVVAAPPPARAAWALSWHGAPIGGAWERDDGTRFERRERIVVRRGDEVVVSELVITIDRDERGEPVAIDVSRWQDGPVLAGVARRSDDGWMVEVEGEPAVRLPGAPPFELVVRDAVRNHGHLGTVILPGWGFAVAELELLADGPAADGRFRASLDIGGRRLEARVRYDADGAVAELIGGDGVDARRAALDADLRPADPPEVVGGNALPADTAIDAPPLAVAPAPPSADRTAEIVALVHRVAAEIEDDLSATAATTGAALAATRGDCTTHALRFAALADEHGIDSKVVTGLRRDGGALVRHRWNLAWDGERWLTVDPTWDEAPAAPALIGLAVHGPRAADLAIADATAFEALPPARSWGAAANR